MAFFKLRNYFNNRSGLASPLDGQVLDREFDNIYRGVRGAAAIGSLVTARSPTAYLEEDGWFRLTRNSGTISKLTSGGSIPYLGWPDYVDYLRGIQFMVTANANGRGADVEDITTTSVVYKNTTDTRFQFADTDVNALMLANIQEHISATDEDLVMHIASPVTWTSGGSTTTLAIGDYTVRSVDLVNLIVFITSNSNLGSNLSNGDIASSGITACSFHPHRISSTNGNPATVTQQSRALHVNTRGYGLIGAGRIGTASGAFTRDYIKGHSHTPNTRSSANGTTAGSYRGGGSGTADTGEDVINDGVNTGVGVLGANQVTVGPYTFPPHIAVHMFEFGGTKLI